MSGDRCRRPASTEPAGEILDAVRHPTRRHILAELRSGGPRNRSELTPDVGESEAEPSRLEMWIYHHHLPRLDDAGFVDWDHETDTVERGERYEDVAPVLDAIEDRGERRSGVPT